MKKKNQFIISFLIALVATICCYKIYYSHHVDFSFEARSIGEPVRVSILYHSPKKPNSWPTLRPTQGPAFTNQYFRTFQFRIPVKKLDTLNILLDHAPNGIELRNIRFTNSTRNFGIQDTWSPDPPIEKLSEDNGIIRILPLSNEQARFRLTGPASTMKGQGEINWFKVISLFVITLLASFGVLQYKNSDRHAICSVSDSRKARIILQITFWSVLAFLAFLLYAVTYYSWTGCDEYWSAVCGYNHQLAFKEPWDAYVHAYMTWNQRIGNCIQFFIITAGKAYFNFLNPIFIIITTLAIIKLSAGRIQFNLATILSILVVFSLLICAVPSPKQTLFLACPTCIYTWVASFWLFFLSILLFGCSYDRKDRKPFLRMILLTGVFLIGFCSGMTNECVIGTLIIFCTIYIFFRRKKINTGQWVGLFGFLTGAIVFFSAPALRVRAAGEATVPVNLTNVSYFERLEYWPMLMSDLFSSTSFALYTLVGLLLLVILLAIFIHDIRRELPRTLATSLAFVAGAVLMSSTYLAGAVPYIFAHLPSSLLIICSCIIPLRLIYSKFIYGKWLTICIALLLFSYAIQNIKEAISFGQQALPYQTLQTNTILNAKKNNVVPKLDKLPISNEDNSYIWIEDLNDPSVRKQAAKYYGISEIQIKTN